ncbi:hypothetical protein BGZ92_005027, partial [Podila epicladia]
MTQLRSKANFLTKSATSLKIESKASEILAEALKALKTIPNLTTLYLQSCKIGDNGAQALGDALKTNPTLVTLDLQSNSIGDIGGQALGEALKTNSTLATLDLQSNSI